MKKVFASAISALVLFSALSYGDTITMKNGEEVKGIVLEEYQDRLLMSTLDGERTIMKSDVAILDFDDEEANLIRLGDQAADNRRYMDAVAYYSKALDINPEAKAAKDGLLYLQLYVSGMESTAMQNDIKRMQDLEQNIAPIWVEQSDGDAVKGMQKDMARYFGLSLAEIDGRMTAVNVMRGSVASMAGIQQGDRLIAVWAHLTGYMSMRDVLEYFLKDSASEVRCTIDRTVTLDVSPDRNMLSGTEDIIGAAFSMEFDGLTVSKVRYSSAAEKADLRPGDLVVSIDDRSTRYMPLKKAVEYLKAADGRVKMTIRRDVTMWRRNGI